MLHLPTIYHTLITMITITLRLTEGNTHVDKMTKTLRHKQCHSRRKLSNLACRSASASTAVLLPPPPLAAAAAATGVLPLDTLSDPVTSGNPPNCSVS